MRRAPDESIGLCLSCEVHDGYGPVQLFVLPNLFAREAPAKWVFHFEKEPFTMRTLDEKITWSVNFDHFEVLLFQCSDDVRLVDVSLPSMSVLA